eukprot:scaffold226534_cov35-Tisochrysis_lutea.AAC.3
MRPQLVQVSRCLRPRAQRISLCLYTNAAQWMGYGPHPARCSDAESRRKQRANCVLCHGLVNRRTHPSPRLALRAMTPVRRDTCLFLLP